MPADWAPFLNETELKMFLTFVEAEVRALGVTYRIGDGIVEVDLEEGTQSLGLANLAQVCAGLPAARWPTAVSKHFSLVIGSSQEEAELREIVDDFEKVRGMLRVRLYETWTEEQFVHPLGDGLAAGVVFDLASAMRSLSRAEADAWGVSDEEIFERALDNLALEEPGEPRTILGPEDVPIVVVEGQSYYTASEALLLERNRLPEGHPYGYLFVAPARHVYFYHLIEDSRVILAVNALVSLAMEAFKRGPGSISHRVFWSRRGKVVAIPWEVEDGTLYVTPPTEFVKEVLDRLAQPLS